MKKLKTELTLEPQTIFNLKEEEIQTEYANFNNLFKVFFNNQKIGSKMDLIKILSPAVQTNLIDLRKEFDNFWINFNEDMVVFMFEEDIFKARYTNFFKKTEVDQRDIDKINQHFKKLLDITSDILKFLD